MRKLLAIVLFVGFAMQIAPPMAGQQPGAAGNGSDKSTQKGQGDKSHTNPAVTAPPLQPKVSSDGTQAVGAGNKEQSVRLTGIPPVTIVEKQKTPLDYVFDWGPWVFNLLLVIVGAIGIWLARRTLNAIDRQAESLRQQVEDARKTNSENAETASRTLKSLETQSAQMVRQADAMDNQLNEMRASSQQTARHLSLTERPWVSLSIRLLTPLTADENGIHMTIRIELINLGSSPAIGVWIDPVLYLLNVNKPHPLDERKRLCEQAMTRMAAKFDMGQMLFPRTNPPYIQDYIINATPDDVKNCIMGAGTPGPYVNGMYSPKIILCVSYRSTVDEAARHYTAVIYDISWSDPQRPDSMLAIPYQGVVPLEQLRVWNDVVGPIAQ